MDQKTMSPAELPDWARELLEQTYMRVQNPTTARRLWQQIFTDQDRAKCGGDIDAAYQAGRVIGMWRTARGGDAGHALLDAARALGFLTAEYHENLTRLCFGHGPKEASDKPHWDKEARQLTYQGVLVREVKRPKQAGNIVAILDAFEAAGWPPRIDDPHGRKSNDETRRRDVENLNKKLLQPMMRFACDGTGTGFLWRAVEPPATKEAATRRRR